MKSFSGEGTLRDTSLPVSLTLWDALVHCPPPQFTSPNWRFTVVPFHLERENTCLDNALSGPVSQDIAIVYRCDTPISRDAFSGRLTAPPKWCDTLILVLSFTQAHLCDTPFCNISHDNCTIPPPPPEKQAPRSFAILLLQVTHDMKNIAAGPLSFRQYRFEKVLGFRILGWVGLGGLFLKVLFFLWCIRYPVFIASIHPL